MFLIRNIVEDDLDEVLELSHLMQFINIPRDQKLLLSMISRSLESFKNPNANKDDNLFIFVCEDTESGKVVGVSLIHGKHGTEEEPHFYLKVNQEHKYSKSLNTGFIHGTLKFGYTSEGYTEIGGLVLDPGYRGHPFKLGKALSFSRFLFIGLNQDLFTETIHVELMPPFDNKGNSPLWEAIGRKFLNMDYHEADLLSRKNKEFILSLFPKDTIYEALLPVNARDAIGKVGEHTLPVKRMLESIGFYYAEEVDPFDGGPHYRANVKDISLINEISKLELIEDKDGGEQPFIISVPHEKYAFYAPLIKGKANDGKLLTKKKFMKTLDHRSSIGFKY